MNLGLNIKLARIAKGWSQQDLAERIHKTRPLISHIELSGKVNTYTLTRICKVLNLDITGFENGFSESVMPFFPESVNPSLLKLKIEKLEDEIELLKELVATQKEVIAELRKKRLSRRK
ncbi:MAG: helix-turn-helix transcriptional regulator [Bacteroidia bacterium]|nr:helix-turn-helix transcriptional regulator [Bacteroidia bacterium]